MKKFFKYILLHLDKNLNLKLSLNLKDILY